MANESSSYKNISSIPDYRALTIIKEQLQKMESMLNSSNCDKLLISISKDDNFVKFRKSLSEVEQHIIRNADLSLKKLDSFELKKLATELKQQFGLTSSEIVMVLNSMPKEESMVELMFAGKFDKKQIHLLCQLVNQYLTKNSNNVKDVEFSGQQISQFSHNSITIKDEI